MNIIGRRNIWFLLSGMLLVPGIISLIVWGLNFGLDFKGGTIIEVKFPTKATVTTEEVRKSISDLKLENLIIAKSGDNSVIIETVEISQEKNKEIQQKLSDKLGRVEEDRFEVVGPAVSKDLTRKAIIAVIIASICIIIYIAFAFRKVTRPANSFRFGISAVLALVHDLLFLIGFASLLGHFFDFEVDALFITAALTVMGFSVHDTIVVFDRIRENLRLYSESGFEEVVNASVIQTLDRSINTSMTVLIVLAALYLFSGETIKNFILALLVGIAIGTYSSIFVASPILVVWQGWVIRRTSRAQ